MRIKRFAGVCRAVVFALVAGTGLSAPGVAAQPIAQSAAVLPARLQGVSRQLVAVQTMTLVRTSGRADSAMVARIDALDTQLRAARQALDAVTANAAGAVSAKTAAEAQVEVARLRYQREAETLFTQLELANSDRDRYRQDLASILVAATPDELAAQRRFGDGDFSVFDPMEAAILARQAAEQANLRRQQGAQLRQLAENYATMLAQSAPGRSSEQLLVRWDRAAAADPSDVITHIQRSRVALILGNLPRAQAAAEDAARMSTQDWQRAVALAELGTIAFLQGDITKARSVLSDGEAIFARLLPTMPERLPLIQLTRASILSGLGAVLAASGEPNEARVAFTKSITLFRESIASNPANMLAKRGIMTTLQVRGELELTAENLEAGIKDLGDSLTIAKELSLANPDSVQAKMDEANSLTSQAVYAERKGLPDVADIILSDCIVIYRSALQSDPSSNLAKRALANGLARSGQFKRENGKASEARSELTESLGILRSLALSDPNSAIAKRDVSSALLQSGHANMQLDDVDTGRSAYNESVSILRALIAADTSSAADQRQLSINLEVIGDFERLAFDFERARLAYIESLAISQKLQNLDPSSVQANRDVSLGFLKLGELLARTGDLVGARSAFNESLMIRRALLAAAPSSPEALTAVAGSLERLADIENGGVTWAQVADHYRHMQSIGALSARNQRYLESAQRRAAEMRSAR
jgi:tetratricopeptide (TPR) repeat protein